MIIRSDKLSKHVLKAAVNYTIERNYKSAAKLMFVYGFDESIIERILYEPNNVRSSDLRSTLHLNKHLQLH